MLSHYRIVSPLGQGGMGEVYVGWDETLQRNVAIKTIRAERRLSDVAKARFRREARTLSKLDHPGICRIYDIVEEEDADFLVLELIRGKSLRSVLDDGPMAKSAVLRLALEVARVLAAAHAAGIVHRDLKPDNLMLTDEGSLKVLDFGLARPLEERVPRERVEWTPPTSLESDADSDTLDRPAGEDISPVATYWTEIGRLVGTPLYMSPEQARREPVTAATDMYAFGLLLQELLTGVPAYGKDSAPEALLRKAARAETEPLAGVNSELARLVSGLQSRAPTNRPTAVETVERLESVLDRPKRTRRRLIAAAILLAFGAGIVKYTLDQKRAREQSERRRAQAENLIGFMLGDLRDKLESVGRLDLLDDVGDQATEYFAAVPESELSEQEISRRAQALSQIGEVRLEQGDLVEATRAFEEALSLARGLAARDPERPEWQMRLGEAHFWVGKAHRLSGNPDEALEEWSGYLKVAEGLVAADPDNPEWQKELGYAHSNIGMLRLAQGDLEGALKAFGKTLEIDRQAVSANPDDLDRRLDLALSHNTVGVVLESLGRLDEAREHFEADLALRQELTERDPAHLPWRDRLAVAHSYAGGLSEAMGDLDSAQEHLETAHSIQRALAGADPANADWQRQVAVGSSILGSFLCRRGNVVRAGALLDDAVQRLEGLVQNDHARTSWQHDLATALNARAHFRLRQAEWRAAMADARAAEELLSPIVESGEHSRRELARALVLQGEGAVGEGDSRQARATFERAHKLLAPMADGSRDWKVLTLWLAVQRFFEREDEVQRVSRLLSSLGYRGEETGLEAR